MEEHRIMSDEMRILTEVGTFGGLGIEDPTSKKTKSKNEEDDLDELINSSIKKNAELNI